ncbi:cobaltochelatase subunit CobN [Desulfosoma sp.]
MKVIGIIWQSYYNLLYRAAGHVSNVLDVELYSARVLDKDPDRLEKVLDAMEEADLVLLYRSVESFWDMVEKRLAKGIRGHVVCLSHDPAYWTLSTVRPDIVSRAYSYLVINGEANLTNMLKFLATEVLGVSVAYEEPQAVPWEGLYHPKAPHVFHGIEPYCAWYDAYWAERPVKGTVGILFSRHYWVNANTDVEDALIEELERRSLKVISAFAYSVKDDALGTKGSGEVVLEWFMDAEGRSRIDAMVKLISFFLGTRRDRDTVDITRSEVASDGVEILKKLNVPCFSPVTSFYKTVEEWEREELNLDIGWAVALPEFEGVIEPIIIAAQREGDKDTRDRVPILDRVEKLADRIHRWVALRKVPVEERRVAFVLHNNPCASVEATVGAGAHLDTLASVADILQKMRESGYRVEAPESGKALIEEIMAKKAVSEFRWTTVEEIVAKGGALALVDKETYLQWFQELPERTRHRMVEAWGKPPGEWKEGIPPAMVHDGALVITGLRYGHAVVCVQPKRGCAGARCDGQVCKILHDPDVPPPHQYVATYKWLSRVFGAHVLIHVGTHGNLEFLPGKGVGLSAACFPDIGIDTMPHLYIYNADNPPEGTVAKRRSYATLVDHMQTVMTGSGLYEVLSELDRLLTEYEEVKIKDRGRAHALQHIILQEVARTNLDKEIRVKVQGRRRPLCEVSHEEMHGLSFDEVVREIHGKLSLIRNTQIQDGMHIFGRRPEGERRVDFIYSILRYDTGADVSLRREVAQKLGYDLSALLQDPAHIDEHTGKPYGTLLEEVDRVSKSLIRTVLHEQKAAAADRQPF